MSYIKVNANHVKVKMVQDLPCPSTEHVPAIQESAVSGPHS